MSRNYSYKQDALGDDTARYMQDCIRSVKIKKKLARFSLVLLLILFSVGFFLTDYIGKEFSIIMMASAAVLLFTWALAAWFYKSQLPTTGSPVDIKAEFGEDSFEFFEAVEEEKLSSRINKLSKDDSVDDSIIKIIE